jgi:hypothetical protein
MLNVEAPIEPGCALGGIPVGTSLSEILATAAPLKVYELPDGVTIHSFGAIRVWSVAGRVEQVGAFEGYAGRTADGIGVGSTIAEIRAACGEVEPQGASGFLVLPDTPGLGMETTEWAHEDSPDPDATVVQIFVHGLEGE